MSYIPTDCLACQAPPDMFTTRRTALHRRRKSVPPLSPATTVRPSGETAHDRSGRTVAFDLGKVSARSRVHIRSVWSPDAEMMREPSSRIRASRRSPRAIAMHCFCPPTTCGHSAEVGAVSLREKKKGSGPFFRDPFFRMV